MTYNRRKFIKLSAGVAATLAIGTSACSVFGKGGGKAAHKFGIQLYTLRDEMPKDPKKVLQQLSSFGYTQIESYEGKDGMFWGLGNIGFKKYVEDLGMKMIASHCDINNNFEEKAANAAAIGMKYLICPWIGAQKSLDDYKRIAASFNEKGEICRKNGIRFAYHNHDYSFKKVDGQFPQSILLDETDPTLVDFEMDMYWVVTAGENVEQWLTKYPNRFKLCHVKDRSKGATSPADTCTLGEGIIDYPSILVNAKKAGVDYFFVEQEKYTNTTQIDCARDNATYMKNFKW